MDNGFFLKKMLFNQYKRKGMAGEEGGKKIEELEKKDNEMFLKKDIEAFGNQKSVQGVCRLKTVS